MDAWNLDRTTSVPKSVLRYGLDKVRSLDLETNMLTEYLVLTPPINQRFKYRTST